MDKRFVLQMALPGPGLFLDGLWVVIVWYLSCLIY